MRRRLRLVVGVSAVFLLAFGTWTIPAIGATGSDQKSTLSTRRVVDPRILAQAPMVAAADRIQRLVDARHLSGFAGTELDGNTLVLYWHGGVPAEVAQTLGQVRRDLPVQVRAARYSLGTLEAEARRLIRAYAGGPVNIVTSAGPLRDYSGLEVGVNPSTPASARRAMRSTVPLVMVDRAPAVPASRWADTPPFWGGAGIKRPVSATSSVACSTAFAARKNSNNVEVMISAQHCGVNFVWNTISTNIFYGQSNAGSNAGLDAMLLGGADYQGVIYVGPAVNSNTGRQVASRGNPANGASICHGGSFSGEVCDATVAGVNQFIPVGGSTIGPGFWTIQQQSIATAGNGDSGGPSYSYNASGLIRAHGVIVVIDTSFAAPCQGVPTSATRQCSIRTFSTNIDSIMTTFGLTILTS
jgi:streptogrisin D